MPKAGTHLPSSSPVVPARRTDGIRYAVRDIVLVAKEAERLGKELLFLNIGDPLQFDHDTPAHLIEAVSRALRDGQNGYAPSEGTPEALEAIRGWAANKGIPSVRDVYVGSGASEAIEVALATLVNAGEEVLVPNPGYPLYSALLSKYEAVAVHYELDESRDWEPCPDDIEARITDKTRAIILINPNNPTGSLSGPETLARIAEVARRHDLVIFSDEIYDELVFDGLEHTATARLCPDLPCVTFGGLSKAYLACGWRIGWAVLSGPSERTEQWSEAIHRVLRSRLCASYPMQAAIPAALDGPKDHIRELLAKLDRRRNITVDALSAIDGVNCVRPRGAFYAFPSIDTDQPDGPLVAAMVRETGVVVVHGSGFGPPLHKAHFRVVFAPPEEILVPAFDKIAGYLRSIL